MSRIKAALLIALFPVLLLSPARVSACYDPGAQRWLNRDPIGEVGGLNLYRCVDNNPINKRDAFGECPLVLAIPALLSGFGITAETATLAVGSVVAAGAAVAVGTAINGYQGSGGSSIAPPAGLSTVNAPPMTIVRPFPITVQMGKGERSWEKGRGDDPYWELSPDELREIENAPKSTPSQKQRARRIRKQKEKDCS